MDFIGIHALKYRVASLRRDTDNILNVLPFSYGCANFQESFDKILTVSLYCRYQGFAIICIYICLM